ncbi:nucleotide-binding protein [Methanopyrus sp.]
MRIAVLGGKGGVGKTVLSIVLASELGAVLVDADVTEPDTPAYLNLERERDVTEVRARYAVRTDGCAGCERCLEVCPWRAVDDPIACDGCGACAIACPEDAIELRETELGRIAESREPELGLRVVHPETEPWAPELADIVHRMIPEDEDCVIDCPAGLGCPVIAALSAADAAVLVTSPDPAALHDYRRAEALTREFGLPAVRVLNRAGSDEREGFDVVIPEDERVLRAALDRDPGRLVHALREPARRVAELLPDGG